MSLTTTWWRTAFWRNGMRVNKRAGMCHSVAVRRISLLRYSVGGLTERRMDAGRVLKQLRLCCTFTAFEGVAALSSQRDAVRFFRTTEYVRECGSKNGWA